MLNQITISKMASNLTENRNVLFIRENIIYEVWSEEGSVWNYYIYKRETLPDALDSLSLDDLDDYAADDGGNFDGTAEGALLWIINNGPSFMPAPSKSAALDETVTEAVYVPAPKVMAAGETTLSVIASDMKKLFEVSSAIEKNESTLFIHGKDLFKIWAGADADWYYSIYERDLLPSALDKLNDDDLDDYEAFDGGEFDGSAEELLLWLFDGTVSLDETVIKVALSGGVASPSIP